MNEQDEQDSWEVIHRYTRAQAIEDGALLDVTDTAREAGFVMPVALTASVYAAYVEPPADVPGQDREGRLWDILWMLRHAIRSVRGASPTAIPFKLYVQNTPGRPAELVTLRAECGPGDDAEPVITIMLLDED